jgi:hypothetical protein
MGGFSGVFRLPSDQAFVNDAETNPGFGVFSVSYLLSFLLISNPKVLDF